MARTPMSEERKKALSEQAKKRWAEKNATNTNTPQETPTQPAGITLSQEQFDALLNRITVAEAAIANKQISPDQAIAAKAELSGVQLGRNGLQGIVYKYEIEPSYYPDPSKRILDMPELSRFAPHQNYEVKWEVSGVEYEKANINYAEPRFKVQILRIMFDDMGQPTNRRAIVGTHYQHEDENVTRMIARDFGLQELDQRELMDEVRFQRIRRWVLDLLTPYRQVDRQDNITEMVIDGKVIPVIEISTNADKPILVNTDSALNQAMGR